MVAEAKVGGSSNFGEYPIPPNQPPPRGGASSAWSFPDLLSSPWRRRGPMHHDTYRLFLCRRCRTQVRLCSCCDRGHAYCSDDCRAPSRHEQVRLAGSRYQRSFLGARRHAARQAEYRRRLREKVTHHGSPGPDPEATLGSVAPPLAAIVTPTPARAVPAIIPWFVSCDRCGHLCRPFARQDFIRRRPSRRAFLPGGPFR